MYFFDDLASRDQSSITEEEFKGKQSIQMNFHENLFPPPPYSNHKKEKREGEKKREREKEKK